MSVNRNGFFFIPASLDEREGQEAVRRLLDKLNVPFRKGDTVGIKIHWGERGNQSYLHPFFTAEIVTWLKASGFFPFVFDTTVLYSGGRRDGREALKTAAQHGFTEDYLGCPVVIADGFDGRDTVDIPANFRHFSTVQIGNVLNRAQGFVIFSHFKGHMAAGFGGAVKNISMGFASRAQKQRMHADVHPELNRSQCSRCGLCSQICPARAVKGEKGQYPAFDREKCIGCAQCIGLCPEVALRIFWDTDNRVFQEKLVETAAAVWKVIGERTIVINALLKITADCDCLPGRNPVIAPDAGLIGGYHPVLIDRESLNIVGEEVIDRTHPGVNWRRQFEYAKEIGFWDF